MIKRLGRYRAFVDRSRWYFVLVQFLMIVIMFIESKGTELYWWHYILIIFGVLCLMVTAGYLDKKLGILKAEQQFYADENPFFQDLLKRIKDL